MEVIVFGSGGFMPQPDVHMPAFLVRHDGASYLFDCGEWTQVRLVEEGISSASLSGIMISHLHGDHVLGLPGVLIRRSHESSGGGNRSLDLFGPADLEEYVRTNQHLLGYDLQFELHNRRLGDGETYSIDSFELTVRSLDHRMETFGFSFTLHRSKRKFNPGRARELGVPEGPKRSRLQHGESVTLESGRTVHPDEVSDPRPPGPKFVYIADTRPVYDYPEAFRNPDLLVHEAMFSAEDLEHAREKKHSTAREAARVASHLDADRLLLTHFSQRYEDYRPLRDEARSRFDATELARDGDRHELGGGR